jgi:site-specific DNA-methyltransferase (adenine-specific)
MDLYHNTGDVTIYHGRAINLLRWLDAGSVSLAFFDPPYKMRNDLWWDKQWKSDGAFLDWIGQICAETKRVLAANGSLYLCASPQMAYQVEGVVREHFNVLNVARWYKEAGWHKKARAEDLRSYLEPWEAVVFAEQWGADGDAMNASGYLAQSDKLRGSVFEPIRAYLAGEFKRAGVPFEKANGFCGVASMAARHYFARSQWCMPTQEHYENLQRGLNNGNPGEYLRRDYEELRRDYEELRRDYEELRRPFFLNDNRPTADLWTYDAVLPDHTKHETEKPLEMLRDIVEISSRPGDLVLDCFMGRGTTAVAASQLGRRFIGGDIQEQWCAATVARLREAGGEWHIRPRRPRGEAAPDGQLDLFEQLEEATNGKV